MNCLMVHSGSYVDLLEPDPATIKIHDIGWNLSHLCRFNGSSDYFYSVAEHSVAVSDLVRNSVDDPQFELAALLHDAHEAYIGDLTTPMKRMLGSRYVELRRKFDLVIASVLQADAKRFTHPRIVRADAMMLAIEAYYLMANPDNEEFWGWLPKVREDVRLKYRPKRMNPTDARNHFFARYNSIITRIHREDPESPLGYAI